MKHVSRLALALLFVGLVFTAPLAAQQDIDWAKVKETWNSLTADEQNAYRELMPKAPSTSAVPNKGTATILGQQAEPFLKTPDDVCPSATNEISMLPYNDTGDTTLLANDYDLDGIGGPCDTTFNSSGNDIAYRVQVDVDCDVTATLQDGPFDEVLFVTTDCSNIVAGCIGATDDGGAEAVSFSATAGTDYFVVVDGWNGASGTGAYTLDIVEDTATGCQLVPVELQSFDID